MSVFLSSSKVIIFALKNNYAISGLSISMKAFYLLGVQNWFNAIITAEMIFEALSIK